jgi:putative two-component system response regulator
MAIADVYDALVSNRPYKSALSHAEVTAIIQKESGTHFDPELVKAFLKCEDKFEKVH